MAKQAHRLLIADDSVTIQKVIRLALANEGYEIQAIADGNSVLEQLSLFRPHVLLVDISLPGKSAFELREELLKADDFKDLKVVVMSSAFENVDEVQLKELEFHGRLVKPFDPSHLRQILDKVLEKNAGPATSATAKDTESEVGEIQAESPSQLLPTPEGLTEITPAPVMGEGTNPGMDLGPSLTPPPAAGEMNQDLWTEAKESSPPESAESKPKSGGGGEEDIRRLTETTIKMSGLDNFQWSVNEVALKPDAKPAEPTVVGDEQLKNLQSGEPNLQPPKNLTDKSEVSLRIDPYPEPGSQEEADLEAGKGEMRVDSISPYTEEIRSNGSSSKVEGEQSNVVPLTTEQMEALLTKQLNQTIEKIARKVLPEVAEKIIREEIRKLLSDPPK